MNKIPNAPSRTVLRMTGVIGCIILPQNGVVEGPTLYGSGDSSPQLAVGSGGDTPKRPLRLGMSTTSAYASKAIEEADDSSLPCTPDSEGERDMSGSCAAGGAAVLEDDTRQLMVRFLRDFTGQSKPQWHEGRELSTMKRVVEGVLEKHRYAYNGMINRLSLDNRSDDTSFVRAVAKNLFADGTTNWGRIASLVAFGAVVCQYLKEKDRGNCVDLVAEEISTYLLSDQRDWLVKNNAWEGFVEFFRVADPESTVRNTLMAVAGFAGLGATLALLIR